MVVRLSWAVACSETEVPYVLSQGIGASGAGQLFNAGLNVIIKLPLGSGYIITGYTANFTIDPSAVFTSLRDDAWQRHQWRREFIKPPQQAIGRT